MSLPTIQEKIFAHQKLLDKDPAVLWAIYFNATNLQMHLDDQNGDKNYWGSDRDIFFANQPYFLFEKIFNYSIEDTDHFDFAQKALITESHINELNTIYLANANEPLYLVVKHTPFIDIDTLTIDYVAPTTDLIDVVELSYFENDKRYKAISSLDKHEMIGEIISTIGVYRIA